MSYENDPTYLGDYDDTCAMCGTEQSVAVYSDRTTWFCFRDEHENEVSQVD